MLCAKNDATRSQWKLRNNRRQFGSSRCWRELWSISTLCWRARTLRHSFVTWRRSRICTKQRRLTDRLNIFYAVTFIGALLVLSGPLPSDAKISAFGFETPLGVLPQQIIAVMTAVAYSMYGSNFASLLLITQMIARVLRKEEPEGWHFIGARYDGSTLWATLLTPRRVGYASPKRHFAIAILILLVSSLAVLTHSFVVLVAGRV